MDLVSVATRASRWVHGVRADDACLIRQAPYSDHPRGPGFRPRSDRAHVTFNAGVYHWFGPGAASVLTGHVIESVVGR